MKTTDKVQVGDSTTETSTSTTYTINSKPPTEYGWACPRCGRINAPWKSQCDCTGNIYQYPTWERPYYDEWWKHVTCTPETTWKAPSSVCTSDSNTCKVDSKTTAWNANSAMETGGSDYWNSITRNWENVPHTLTNMQKELDEIKFTFSNTLRGE